MALTREEINEIATRTADEVMERVNLEREERELCDHIIGGAMGEGAIPLYGRETRKEPCSCCLIDPEGPNAPENRMCTTKGAIGTLSNREEREWCSEIKIVADGRCARARTIREAARECKEKHPSDTEAFFTCYAPAFSKITKGGNPGEEEPILTPEVMQFAQNMDMINPEYSFDGRRWRSYSDTKVKTTDLIKQLKKHTATMFIRKRTLGKVIFYSVENVNGKVVVTDRSYTEEEGSNPGEYVTITDPGGTTFKVGEIISHEAFERENERVKRLSKKPATGR